MDELKIERDARVLAGEREVGRVMHVIVDPQTKEITQVVVAHDGRESTVPIAAVASTGGGVVRLRDGADTALRGDFVRDAFHALDDRTADAENAGVATHGGAPLRDAAADAVVIGRPDALTAPVDPSVRATQGEQIVIPVVEERLTVGTREVDLGEVIIRKRVVEETTMVPVTTRREEIEIVRREAGQPWPPGADEAAPGVELTRVPLRGEEPVIGIRQVVAREVVIDKGRVAEERQITDTVRREHVEVEERYRQVRPHLQEQFAAQRTQAPDAWARGRTFEQAEPQYRAGFSAASDPRYAQRDFAEVEPDLRQDLDTTALADGDRWQQLRAEIRAGWDAARGR